MRLSCESNEWNSSRSRKENSKAGSVTGSPCAVSNVNERSTLLSTEEWITPYTENVVEKLIEDGNTEIVVYSPSFVADCLETTDELGHELVNEAKEWGGNIHPVECLNADEQWCIDFAKYTFIQAEGSAQDKEDIEYQLQPTDYDAMEPQVMKSGH